jgi:hypothetical protein
MAAAALTPRVRIMAVCDKVRENRIESGVFNLKGVRQEISASSFPCHYRLWLFLVLSSPRAGVFPAYVVVVDDKTDKTIFYAKVLPDPVFQEQTDYVTGITRLRCAFPEAGRYTIQVWFFQDQGSDVVKGQLPFRVVQEGE